MTACNGRGLELNDTTNRVGIDIKLAHLRIAMAHISFTEKKYQPINYYWLISYGHQRFLAGYNL